MTASQITLAVTDYLEREAAAMRTVEGADHKAILLQVASDHDLSDESLREAVISHTAAGAN